MKHQECGLADGHTMVVKNLNAGPLSRASSMLRPWTHDVAAVDVGHNLAKKDKVQFLFSE